METFRKNQKEMVGIKNTVTGMNDFRMKLKSWLLCYLSLPEPVSREKD